MLIKDKKKKIKTIWNGISNSHLLLALIMIIILQIPIAFEQINNWYNSTINKVNFKENKVEKLNVGTNFHFFTKIIGDPVVSRYVKLGSVEYKEDYFIDKLYYIQTITTHSGTVVFFAVTTRDKNFNPTFKLPGKSIKISLNKNTFSDLKLGHNLLPITINKHQDFNEDGNFNYYLGAHDFNYYERYYLANPGNYQTVYFGVNESGDFTPNNTIIDKVSWEITSDELNKFRKSNYINTFAITAPEFFNFEIDDRDPALDGLGVDYNTVRIFNF